MDVQYQRCTLLTEAACPIRWNMTAILCDAVVVARTRPRAIPLAIFTIRKEFHGFLSMGLRLAALRAVGAPLKMASGIARRHIRKTTTTSQNTAAILQLIETLRSFPSIALRILTAHNVWRH